MSGRKDVLVVRIKSGSIRPDCFEAFREYIISSILRDVLVLDETTTLSIEELPCVKLPDVLIRTEVEPGHTAKEELEVDAKAEIAPITPAEEKQKILGRLLAYRDRKGLGSLNAVAAKTRSKAITTDVLRMLLAGDATLNISEWRAIGKALDKLEEGGADGI